MMLPTHTLTLLPDRFAICRLAAGAGIPHPPAGLPAALLIGHRLPAHSRVVSRSVLGGLHHEYELELAA